MALSPLGALERRRLVSTAGEWGGDEGFLPTSGNTQVRKCAHPAEGRLLRPNILAVRLAERCGWITGDWSAARGTSMLRRLARVALALILGMV